MGNASRGGRPIDGKRTLRGGPPDCFRSSPSPLRFLFFGSFFSFSERKERTDLFPKEKERTEKTHSTSSGPVERESSTAMRFSGQRPSAVSLASSALIMLPESREEIVMAMLCSACSNRSSQPCGAGQDAAGGEITVPLQFCNAPVMDFAGPERVRWRQTAEAVNDSGKRRSENA